MTMFRFLLLFLFLQNSFAQESTVPFPKSFGEYEVGLKNYTFKDFSRREDFRHQARNSWECNINGAYRSIPVDIYYPAKNKEQFIQATYLPVPVAKVFGLPDQLTKMKKQSFHNANAREGKFPVVFFSPGLGISSLFYTALLEEVASHGYIVVAFSHPFMSGNVYLTDSQCVIPMLDLPTDREVIVVLLEKLISKNLGDFAFVKKKLKSLFDFNKFFVMGHSGGGMSATIYCDRPFVKCDGVINLDGGDYTGIGVEVPGAWAKKKSMPYLKLHSASFPNLDKIPAKAFGKNHFLVDIDRIDHQTFSDKAFFPGMISVGDGELLNPYDSHAIITSNILSFLKAQTSRTEVQWPIFGDYRDELFHLKK